MKQKTECIQLKQLWLQQSEYSLNLENAIVILTY